MPILSERSKAKQWNPDQITSLLLWWNDDPETWEFAASLGADVERRYWQRKPAWTVRGDTATLEMAARKYLDVERALSARNVLHNGIETVAPEILFEALDKAMYEGGGQERAFAAQAADWAKAAIKWPRAYSMLLQISRSWNEDAKREDERARQDEMKSNSAKPPPTPSTLRSSAARLSPATSHRSVILHDT